MVAAGATVLEQDSRYRRFGFDPQQPAAVQPTGRAVPEPATWLSFGIALLGIALWRRRRAG